MKINPKTGLLEATHFIPSPNTDERPQGVDMDLVVLHSISLPPGEYGGHWIEKLFTNELPENELPYFKEIGHLQVSAHVLIQRDGSLIQFVPFHKRAWHAGESSYEGRTQCNDFSIGIELEGTDTDDFMKPQYQILSELIACLEQSYENITLDRITGHSEISPGRKTDPGTGFNWDTLNNLLNSAD